MSHFISNTMHDLRGGRQSWRVLVLFDAAALLVGVGTTLISRGF